MKFRAVAAAIRRGRSLLRTPPFPSLLLATLLAVGLPASGFALVWEVHNNANNLASVSVAAGRIWSLSLDGVHAYDPVTGRFQRYFREPAGLVSNRTVVAAADARGNVWVGTDGGGASFLNVDGRWRSATAQQGLPSDSVRVLEPFGEGMWIGTQAGLAFFVESEIIGAWPDGVTPSPFLADDVRAIEVLGTRTWVGTIDGVYTTTDGVAWQSVVSGLGSTNIRSLAHDGVRLWALTADGSLWWGGETGTWSSAPGSGRSLTAAAGALYLATSGGVLRWNEGLQLWQSLGGPNALRADADQSGNVWAAAATGLWRYNGSSWLNLRSPGPEGNWIQGMAMQGATLYAASRLRGTARFDESRGWRTFLATTQFDTAFVSNNFHFACLVDRQGYKWIGDWDGSLARFDDTAPTTSFTHFFRSATGDSAFYTFVWASAHDPQGSRWFGLDTNCRGCGPAFEARGLVRIDDDGSRHFFQPSNSAMSGNQVRSIAFAPDNTMWVGYADAGVDVFQDRDLQTRVTHIDAAPTELLVADVWSIVFEGADAWVLCSGNAVKLRRNGSSTERLATLFLPSVSGNGAVQPMVLDAAGALWVGTTGGLLRRDPSGVVSSLTTANSPLLSNDVHSLAYDPGSGELWVGTLLGLNRILPDAPPSNRTVADLPALIVAPNPQRVSAIGSWFRVSDGNGEPLSRTDVRMYDLRGRLVGEQQTDDLGQFFWQPQDRYGRRLSVGIYYLRSYGFDETGHLRATGNGRVVLAP